MRQVLLSFSSGVLNVVDVPRAKVKPGQVLIHSSRSLVSSGTERMLVEFGRAGWFDKARLQPDKIRAVRDKARTDGFISTIEAISKKLDEPVSLGYCNVGCIAALGEGVKAFSVGDRVVSNGQHAELVTVPTNLCSRVPENVTDEEAAFTVIGAIALQGIRIAQPSLGEAIVVTGLGLVGLLTVQLLRAQGCRVLGIDFDAARLELARQFGAETVDLSNGQDPVVVAEIFSRGRGVDAVIITASTRSSEPVHQGASMCRKRGRIVLVGVTGLELSREDFFKKELTFQVSASYGPGRYDPNYEEKGQDYPIGYVRWTVQRNFEAVLDMMADRRLDVRPLISHRFPIDQAEQAYGVMTGSGSSLGILLTYPSAPIDTSARTVALREDQAPVATSGARPAVSFLGAGNYATAVLIPAFAQAGARLRSVASSAGVSGLHAGRKFGFQETTTDSDRLFSDPGTEAIVITTRHDSHARFVLRCMQAGKHVFVEKPLCLTRSELEEIEAAGAMPHESLGSRPLLMVGFNRRFAPQVLRIKQLLAGVRGPRCFVLTVNAGAIPADHWTQDWEIGGGRIIGEACHFIDLLRFLAGSSIVDWSRVTMDATTADTTSIALRFADGSIGTIHYFANGSKSFPKERLEVFAAGRVLQLDNFRRLTGYGWPSFRKMNLWRQDKGQRACAAAFLDAIQRGGPAPIPWQEIIEVAQVSIDVANGGR